MPLNAEAVVIIRKRVGKHPTHVFSFRGRPMSRSVPERGTRPWKRRESTISAGMICGIPGRAGTCSKGRPDLLCKSWADGKARRSCGVTRTWRLNILPRMRIAYALCGLWKMLVMAQIRHRPQMKKGCSIATPSFDWRARQDLNPRPLDS